MDDALQADRHLNQMPSVEMLKDQMVHTFDGAISWWVKVVVSGRGRVLNYNQYKTIDDKTSHTTDQMESGEAGNCRNYAVGLGWGRFDHSLG